MKTSELTGAALDWAVAKCEDDDLAAKNIQYPQYAKYYPKISPSTDWAQGGPIIEREKINVSFDVSFDEPDGKWTAEYWPFDEESSSRYAESSGQTPLIAAMRCYVASKLGDDVELPEELK